MELNEHEKIFGILFCLIVFYSGCFLGFFYATDHITEKCIDFCCNVSNDTCEFPVGYLEGGGGNFSYEEYDGFHI